MPLPTHPPRRFTPQCFSFTNLKSSFEEIQLWFAGKADSGSADHKGDWAKWHRFRLAEARGKGLLAKVRDNVRLAVLRCVLLLSAAAALHERSRGCATSRFGVLLVVSAAMPAAMAVFYLLSLPLRSLRTRRLRLRGSRWLPGLGTNWLRAPAQLAALGGCAYGYGHFVRWYATDWGGDGVNCLEGDLHNWGLFVFCGLAVATYLLQMLGTLADAPSRKALAKDKDGKHANPSAAARRAARAKLALIGVADFFYFASDALICAGLLAALFLLSLLHIGTLQSSVLFRSRDFARVISNKLRHADLLERILS